jgi:hypothetical protein
MCDRPVAYDGGDWGKIYYDELTCKDCIERGICPFTDDPYNTNGNCLAILSSFPLGKDFFSFC